MATIESLPGAFILITRMIVDDRMTHKQASDEIKRCYPTVTRGISERSVRRFCDDNGIHVTSRLSDMELDNRIRVCVARVSVFCR